MELLKSLSLGCFRSGCLLCGLFFVFFSGLALAQFTPPANVSGIPTGKNWTSIQFGPDDRLYALNLDGDIFAFKIQRTGTSTYAVQATEIISQVRKIPNHNDNGSLFNGNIMRESTGFYVEGTAAKPVLYVGSSDYRVGGPEGDLNLDTNSGVISRLSWKHSQAPALTNTANYKEEDLWDKVDIVRGLPRSEENHMHNGMQAAVMNGKPYLFVAVGGLTNAGAPSRNFTKITEYALAAAVIYIDLQALNAMSVQTDKYGQKYLYDLPTLDDPTRPNINGITDPAHASYDGKDVGDPWGGNDGLNQAKIVAGGPVQIFSPGYRNSYDLVITEAGRLYLTDNGPNGGWGGLPTNEGPPVNGISKVTNAYHYVIGSDGQAKELGGDSGYPYNGQMVNNKDQLHLVTGTGSNTIHNYKPNSFYGGHPTPVRANPAGAGLYTHYGTNTELHTGYFRTQKFKPNATGDAGDPNKALPADWPPVPLSMANPIEGDYLSPGDNDGALLIFGTNTNALMEYKASNLQGAFKGNLFAGHGDLIRRVELNSDGSVKQYTSSFVASSGNNLGLTSQGDNSIFPGTIWIATLSGAIRVMEPNDYSGNTPTVCYATSDPLYDPTADYDGDRYTNKDEIDNGTDHCASTSFPADNDKDFISDLNDPDDDNDGILDYLDPFQIDLVTSNGMKNLLPFRLDILSTTGHGFFNVGFSGLMTNLNASDDYQNWLDNPETTPSSEKDIVGGAVGVATIFMTDGDALTNTQRKGLQFGVNLTGLSGELKVNGRLIGPFFSPENNGTAKQSYGIFIGTGDQNNYIKLVRAAGGLQVVMEEDGKISQFPVAAMSSLPTQTLDLTFVCNPGKGEVQAAYSVNGGALQLIGSPFLAPAKVAAILQEKKQALAVGIIGTTGGGGNAKFSASYDYFQVTGAVSSPSVAIRLNAGGGTFTAGGGQAFAADQYFGGTSATYSTTAAIAGTTDDALYQSERYGNFSYNIPVASGTYKVRLHFAEIYFTYAGGRVFSVTAEGKALLTNYDIFADVGHATAVVKEFDVSITDGTLNLAFTPSANNAKLSAIEVLNTSGTTNKPPLVDAGADKTITLPTNSTSFTATASDPDGSIASYQWTKVSGPSATLSSASTATLSLSNLLEGTYTFQVLVTDDKGATATDQVNLTVNPSSTGTTAIRLNAGGGAFTTGSGLVFAADQYFGTGSNTFTTTKSIANTTDDALYQSERWGKFSYNIPVPIGTYKVRLHLAEIAFGSANSRIFSVSGEGKALLTNYDIFADVGHATATVKEFDVSVTDGTLNLVFTASVDNAKVSAIEVLGQSSTTNQPPVVDAGADKTITLPTNSTSFTATASDPDGTIASYLWEKVSGPAATLSGTATATLSLSNLLQGSYTFQVTVKDDKGASATDQVNLTVNPSGGTTTAIRINAGGSAFTTGSGLAFAADQYFGSGSNAYTTTKSIAGTTDDALYQSERWGKFSYNIPVPSGTYKVRLHFAEIAYGSVGSRIFSVSGEGQSLLSNYDIFAEVGHATATVKEFDVSVSDGTLNLVFTASVDNGKISAIEVLGQGGTGNQSPVVDAGADKTITLPTNSTTFTATASDPDGTIASYLWEKVSGPSASMSGTATATLSLSNLLEGSYTFQITVKDDKGATASDQVNLAVNTTAVTFAAPSNLTAQGVSASQINLSWQDNTTDETGFVLERSTQSNFSGSIAYINIAANSTTYQDKNKKEGVIFYYRIKAVKGSESSAYSIVASAAPGASAARTEGLSVYPNTFNSYVIINIKDEEEAQDYDVRVFDLLGKIYYEGRFDSLREVKWHRIDFQDPAMPQGVYLVRLTKRKSLLTETVRILKGTP